MKTNPDNRSIDFRIKQLHSFQALAHFLDPGEASRALAISRPALTLRVRTLETRLQSRLFVRTAEGLRLTEAGQRFLFYSRRILDTIAQAQQRLRTDFQRRPTP